MIKFNLKYFSTFNNSDYIDELFKNEEFNFLMNSDKYCMENYTWSIDEKYEDYLCLKYPQVLTKITKDN